MNTVSRQLKPGSNVIEYESVQLKLKKQKAQSVATSVAIACLTVILLALVLKLINLVMEQPGQEKIVSYSVEVPEESEVTKRMVQMKPERNPASSPSTSSKVISGQAISPVVVSIPQVDVPVPALGIGDGDDFGDGAGDGWGNGSGGGAGFFNTTTDSRRVLFLVDYSGSMKGKRAKLMRSELAKSIGNLYEGTEYQLIFFSGPAWVAGNDVSLRGREFATISDGDNVFRWNSNGSAHDWEELEDEQGQSPSWKIVSFEGIKEDQRIIKRTKLEWGTDWESAFSLAFRMEPLPETIFFMTDGLSGKDSNKIAKKWSRIARREGVTINAISLMEPNAEEAMKRLAKRTGGQFSIVDEKGNASVER